MPKVQVEVCALEDVDVTHISLVKRGANRVPFRFTKAEDNEKASGRENNMNKSFLMASIFKNDAPKAVSAIIVSPSVDQDSAVKFVESVGFSVEKMETTEQGTVFAQGDADYDPAVDLVVKVSDKVGYVVSGVAKAFEGINFESQSFNEMIAQEGFFPGIRLGFDTLHNTMLNIVDKADSADALTEGFEEAIEDFKTFVAGLARTIPETAFKIEAFDSATLTQKEEGAEGDKEDESDATNEVEKVEEVQAEGYRDAPAAENEDGGEEVAKDETSEALKGIVESLEALRTSMDAGQKALAEKADAATQKVEALVERVEQVEKLAKSADDAVRSAVPGAENPEDREFVLKGENGEVPYIDTAFQQVQ